MTKPPVGAPIDPNGNLSGDGTRTFEWDAQDQLIAINQGTHRSEFAYDGQQRRVRFVEKENATVVSDQRLLWTGNEIAQRRDASGTAVTAQFYRYGWTQDGVAYFRTHDHLTSTRDVTDTTGSLQARYAYEPSGRTARIAGNMDDPFTFTGVLAHSPSGLFLMKRRSYSADLGRWLSEDPLGMKDGPNLYAYVLNEPLRWIDPSGTVKFNPPNGNLLPGYRDQQPGCDVSGSAGAYLNNRPCIVQCCEDHDRCYEANRCNWTSWLTIPASACGMCNMRVAWCIVTADKSSTGCTKCPR